MKYVHRMCYEEINDNCSKLGHKAINRNFDETMKCVSDSFISTGTGIQPNFQKDDNKILKEEAEKWKALGSAYWPSIVVNERTYRGDMVPDNVMTAICSAFSSEPSYCIKFREDIGQPAIGTSGSGVTRNVLLFVVLFLVILNVFIILLYRRCQNRELKQNMQLQVNSAVSQYFALSTRNTSGGMQ
jgi:hypothetical protein